VVVAAVRGLALAALLAILPAGMAVAGPGAIYLAGGSPAPASTQAAVTTNSAPTVSGFEPTMQTQQVEQQAIQQRVMIAPPQVQSVPVGQMPMVLSYEVPTLRLRARYKLIQNTGKKKSYQLPALSMPAYAPPVGGATIQVQGK
jgi:hypothetical protein